jgi:hypothetical protein
MLSFLFSYHQVMPSFLDFVFPFGKQEYARDFHFSGLREESRLGAKQRGLNIPELGRSGNEIRLCYNLRSVERSEDQLDLPWSIRQSAVYHSFDLKSGKSLWINVKGNKLIYNRILEASTLPSISKIESLSEAFSGSLATHLLLCDWSGENWRWYLNDLENQVQALTRNALIAQIDEKPSSESQPVPFPMNPMSPTSPRMWSGSFPLPLRTFTGKSLSSPRSHFEPFSSTLQSRTTTLVDIPEASVTAKDNCYNQGRMAKARIKRGQSSRQSLGSLYDSFKNLRGHSLQFWEQSSTQETSSNTTSNAKSESVGRNPGGRKTPPELPPTLSDDIDQESGQNFTFSDLQRIRFIEEKTQEAFLVLKLNTEVLEELRQHYICVTKHAEFPTEIKDDCQTDLARFDKCVLGVKKDLQMLQSRTETLLHLLANRNSLVSILLDHVLQMSADLILKLNSILQYRSVKANEFFAKKAQVSADHMETMTIEMHKIAQKTKQETVSMRVITSVTLFFLPSTFIAVCDYQTFDFLLQLREPQTFMSTDILNFNNNTQEFQLSGLKVYLAIALPMTALTFLAWFIIFRLTKRARVSSSEGSEDFNHQNAV